MVDFGSFIGGVAGGSTVAIVIKAYDEYSKELGKAEKDVVALGKKGALAYAALATAAVGAVAAITNFAIEAAEASDVQEQFNRVVGDRGVDVLKEMQKETLGTVDKFTLMSAATAAVIRGINVDALPTITRFAMQMKDAGVATGSVSDVINEISTALATGRTAALARYGIEVKGLGSDAEKAAEALKQIARISGDMASPTADAADAAAKLGASWKEFKVELGNTFGPAVTSAINFLSESFRSLREGLATISAMGQQWEHHTDLEDDLAAIEEKRTGLLNDILFQTSTFSTLMNAGVVPASLKQLGIEQQTNSELDEQNKKLYSQLSIREKIRRLGLDDYNANYYRDKTDDIVVNTKNGPRVGVPHQDFVMRPGQGAVPFSPQDTLIGVKDPSKLGGGVTVYIESVQGLDPDAVAEALHKSLRKVVSI